MKLMMNSCVSVLQKISVNIGFAKFSVKRSRGGMASQPITQKEFFEQIPHKGIASIIFFNKMNPKKIMKTGNNSTI